MNCLLLHATILCDLHLLQLPYRVESIPHHHLRVVNTKCRSRFDKIFTKGT